MRVLLIADTHVPRRAKDLPAQVWSEVARADVVVHAGDWTEIEGVRLAVVHETGPATGRERRCAAAFPDTDVLVFGHSHIPWDTTTATGLRLLNPGSPTDRRRQPDHTFMTCTMTGGRLSRVRLHRLPSGTSSR